MTQFDPETVERVALAIANSELHKLDLPELKSVDEFRYDGDRKDYLRLAQAALAAAWEWRPISDADTSREIIALAKDGSVYRMDTHLNHRGETCWQTWMNAGFVDGYITHFVYFPAAPEVKP